MLNKKNILCTIVTGLAGLWVASASAASEGFYMGGQVGAGISHQPGYTKSGINSTIPVFNGTNYNLRTSSSNRGLAGRLYAGYQVNTNLATELGFTKFHNATEKATVTIPGESGSINSRNTIKTNAVDLVAKGILPLQAGFGVYGKAGVAYITQATSVTNSVTDDGQTVAAPKVNKTTHKFYPTFGAGVTYSVTQNVDADLSWARIQKVGSSSSIPSSDFVGLGLSYHFG